MGTADVEEGLVQGDALHERREGVEDGVQALAVVVVAIEPGREEDGVGAQAAGPDRGHGRVHPEHAGLIGAGGHHAAVPGAAHDHRLPRQRRLL